MKEVPPPMFDNGTKGQAEGKGKDKHHVPHCGMQFTYRRWGQGEL